MGKKILLFYIVMSKKVLVDSSLLNGSANAASNTSFQQSVQRPHQHVFYGGSFEKEVNQSIYVPCNFPVKEVRVRANYSYSSDLYDSWYAVSDMPCFAEGGGVCMGLSNTCSYDSKNDNYIYSGGFGDTELVYILRQPMLLQGNWNVQIKAVSVASLNNPADILFDFEFLG